MKFTHFEITIDGKTYQAKNGLEEVKPEPETRQLTMVLSMPSVYTGMHGADEIISDRVKVFLARAEAFKATFSRRFSKATLKQETCSLDGYGDNYIKWKFILEDCKEYHIEWAKSASNCGLIDSFIAGSKPE